MGCAAVFRSAAAPLRLCRETWPCARLDPPLLQRMSAPEALSVHEARLHTTAHETHHQTTTAAASALSSAVPRVLRVGKMIIANLIDEARERGCYKARAPSRATKPLCCRSPAGLSSPAVPLSSQVILDCSEENVAFYEKQEFAKKDVHMAIYFE